VVDTDGFQVYITNLSTGEVLKVESPQEEISELIEATWATKETVGGSTSVLHFGNTKAKNVGPILVRWRSTSETDIANGEGAIGFLQSLVLAADPGGVGITGAEPPRVQFIWPESMAIECRVTSVRITRRHFNKDGRTLDFDAEVAMIADPVVPPSGPDVRLFGSL
jgi:hypothetical protein